MACGAVRGPHVVSSIRGLAGTSARVAAWYQRDQSHTITGRRGARRSGARGFNSRHLHHFLRLSLVELYRWLLPVFDRFSGQGDARAGKRRLDSPAQRRVKLQVSQPGGLAVSDAYPQGWFIPDHVDGIVPQGAKTHIIVSRLSLTSHPRPKSDTRPDTETGIISVCPRAA